MKQIICRVNFRIPGVEELRRPGYWDSGEVLQTLAQPQPYKVTAREHLGSFLATASVLGRAINLHVDHEQLKIGNCFLPLGG